MREGRGKPKKKKVAPMRDRKEPRANQIYFVPAGMLSVGNGILNDVFQKHLEDRAGLLIDQTGDTLDTTTTSDTADSGLSDTLDGITNNLTVALSSTLAETLTSLTTSRHDFKKVDSDLCNRNGRLLFGSFAGGRTYEPSDAPDWSKVACSLAGKF
jgi:hypothetical protein